MIDSFSEDQRISQLARNWALVMPNTQLLYLVYLVLIVTLVYNFFCLLYLSVLSGPSGLSVLPCLSGPASLSAGVPNVPQPVECDQ